MTARVLITHWVHDEVLQRLRARCEVIANESRDTWPQEQVAAAAEGCDAMIAFMPDRVDDAFLARCPRLRIVAAALKGADNFEVAAFARRGVWLTRVPDLLTEPTADLAMALLLSLTRHLRAGDDFVRSGNFRGWRPLLYGAALQGASAGLIGCGAVGRALARRLAAFGARVLYADPEPAPGAGERVDLDALLARSDFVFPLVHLTPETRHLIGAAALARLKPGAYLVNVGRGSVVDETAVADALEGGRLAGYAADVFELEDIALEARPRAIAPRLLELRERTWFTPHLGSAVDSVRRAIALEAAESVLEALAGRRPRGALAGPSLLQ